MIYAAVACILLAEVALFSWSFGAFFCGDSLFYLWYQIDTPAKLLQIFAQPDHLHSYRPLTYVVATYLLVPLFGLDPLRYHFVTLGVHLLIGLMVFGLLRQIFARPGAALGGLLFFAIHSITFYITYDITFLPDQCQGLFYAAGLLAYALYLRYRRIHWLGLSVGGFILALLSKESSIAFVVGVVVVDLLLARRERAGGAQELQARYAKAARRVWLPSRSVWPFFVVALIYLGWLLYIKGGALYPAGPAEPYAVTLDASVMKLKLRYLVWFANFPAPLWDGVRSYLAIAAMLPALGFIVALLARARRVVGRELLFCAAWAFAGLLPVLFIAQTVIKHNLFMPVLAGAVGLALMIEAAWSSGSHLLPRGWQLLALGMVASTTLQLPGDLSRSHVSEGSRIARNSLDAVKGAYPTLPRNALLYLLPTDVKGASSWYFENGALFKLFYGDPSLRMLFADDHAQLPEDFAHRSDVFIFRYHDFRLWDATRETKRDALDRDSIQLLERTGDALMETSLPWQPEALLGGKHIAARRSIARSGQSRPALIEMPGSTVSLALPAIPAGSLLQLGVTLAGPLRSFGRARIRFEDPAGSRWLGSITLDAQPDAQYWWDWEIDLADLAGRQGRLVFETEPDQDADWMAWSRLRIVPRNSQFLEEYRAATDRPLEPVDRRLLDRAEEPPVAFDRTEFYPDYAQFSTPNSKPVFQLRARGIRPARYALVTIAGATARYSIAGVPPGATLEVAAANLGGIGDGVQGTLWIEDENREKVLDELLPPAPRGWRDLRIPLNKWAGKSITIALQASSGPRRQTPGDWCGWARLRITTQK